MEISVYLNETRCGAFGFRNKVSAAELRLAARFDLDDAIAAKLIDGKPIVALERVFEQLNLGGDIAPAEQWTVDYRDAGNRSLSVGDVVVAGEAAFAVASFGWDHVTTDELHAAINNHAVACGSHVTIREPSGMAHPTDTYQPVGQHDPATPHQMAGHASPVTKRRVHHDRQSPSSLTKTS